MSVKDLELINVLNYNENVVAVTTKNESYLMQPAEDDMPSILPLTPSEIEFINGNSSAFKVGTLRFEEDIEEEVYTKLLKMVNWKDILKNDEIKDILIHPTLEGLQKILDIKTSTEFERVRGIFVKLKNQKNNFISLQVEDLISARYRELVNHQTKTNIVLQPKDVSNNVVNEEVNVLKEQNKSLQDQMAQMQKMMEQMLAMQSQNNTEKVKVEKPEKVETKTTTTQKSTASKAKTNK